VVRFIAISEQVGSALLEDQAQAGISSGENSEMSWVYCIPYRSVAISPILTSHVLQVCQAVANRLKARWFWSQMPLRRMQMRLRREQ
jgi:hypothetical protein